MSPIYFGITCFLSGCLFFCSCSGNHKEENESKPVVVKDWEKVEELMNVDREFSAYCRDSGMRKAFFEYLDEEGVLLRPNHPPLSGAEAFSFLSAINDKVVEISWKVQNGDIARSGDLGYTYGIYTIIDKQDKDTIQRGTYGMVWKKQPKGDWKLVMDTGSTGLGENADSVEKEKDFEQ